MAWIIVKKSNTLLHVTDNGKIKGQIAMQADTRWKVELMMVPGLDFTSEYEKCIGYVRGVEATVNLYAKEIGLKEVVF